MDGDDYDRKQFSEPQSIIRAFSEQWEFECCYKYKSLQSFDDTVLRAIELAKRAKDLHGEQAYFKVLLPLGEMTSLLR